MKPCVYQALSAVVLLRHWLPHLHRQVPPSSAANQRARLTAAAEVPSTPAVGCNSTHNLYAAIHRYWPSTRFPPDLWRWFEEDTASIRRLIHSGYMARERRRVLTIEESGGCSSFLTKSDHLKPRILRRHHWSSASIRSMSAGLSIRKNFFRTKKFQELQDVFRDKLYWQNKF